MGSSESLSLAICLFWLFAMCGVLSPLSAQGNGSGEEPPSERALQTEIVETQDKGQVTITSGSGFAGSEGSPLFQYTGSIEYGLTDHLQVKFEVSPSLLRRTDVNSITSSSGDWLVGTKYDFLDLGGSGVHAAVGFNFLTPVKKRGRFSSGVSAYNPYFVIAKDLPAASRIFSQVGFDLLESVNPDRPNPAHVFNWSTGYYVPVSRFLITSELTFSSDRWSRAGKVREIYFTPGVFRPLSDRWWVGGGVAIGLTPDAASYGAMFTLIHEFNVFSKLP